MRIAQIVGVVERVPPKKYGGTERVVSALTEELVRRGHEVTLFATGDSETSAKLVSVIEKNLREANAKQIYFATMKNLLHAGNAYAHHREFDIIHDHNPFLGLPLGNLIDTPTVMTWHGQYTEEVVNFFSKFKNPYVVGISKSQIMPVQNVANIAGVVHNGLNMQEYPFSETHDGYLLFVGRFSAEKGVHVAIDAALELKLPLIIAAKLDPEQKGDVEYFHKEIEPRLKKHPELIKWVGEVEEAERNRLMSKAMCLLFPVNWPEPFGLAVIEAMACGCPVVAYDEGSVPEIVENKKTGYIVKNFEELLAGVKNIKNIDRQYCREHALSFSAEKMTTDYEKIYNKILNDRRKR